MLIGVTKYKTISSHPFRSDGRFKLGKGFFVFLFLFFFNSLSSFSQSTQFEFTPNLQRIYTEICQFKIGSAKQNLTKESNKNGIKILLDDFADMISILNNGSQADYEKLLIKESERLELIESMDKKSPYNKFIQAEIKLHWTLLKYRFGNEVKASWNFIQAYRLLEENQKEFPNFIPQYKTLGSVHFILGSIPDSYSWITKVLGLKGNSKQGLKELQTAQKDPIYGIEAQFYEHFFNGFFLKMDDRKYQNLLKFFEKNDNYLSIAFLATSISLKDQRSDQANQIIQKLPTGNGYLTMPIFDLYKGDINLQKGNYEVAANTYQNYIRSFKGKVFLKEANQKLFFTFWFNNESEKGIPFLNKIPNVGNELADADKFAQKIYENYAKNKYLPNKSLMKARFAFDGGYFERAIKEIEEVKETEIKLPKERSEFQYRKGRIYQKINQIEKAKSAYNQAIKLSEGQEWGYGALSTLQIGYILKEQGNKIEAKKYFEKALAYKKHESKNSVDSKAKAALSE